MTGRVLVIGGAGFIGANIADRLAQEGCHVLVYDALRRPGVEENLAWLQRRHARLVTAVQADIRDAAALAESLRGVEALSRPASPIRRRISASTSRAPSCCSI